MTPFEELAELMKDSGVQIKFGLQAQGHIPIIHRMLSEGRSWKDIGEAIHWDPETARVWFLRYCQGMQNVNVPKEDSVMTPVEKQKLAARLTGYGAIALRRSGDYAIVEVERDGQWVEVIREHVESNFSHIVEPLGIEGCLTEAGLMGLHPK